MAKSNKNRRTGPFGARYGWKLRKKIDEIEAERKKRHNCPNCRSQRVKRVSVGIWMCRKCTLTFTGGAYTPYSKIGEEAKRSIRGKSLV